MNLRELRYVIYGEDKLSSKLQKITAASDKASKALGGHSEKLSFLQRNISVAKDVVPGFNNQLLNLGNASKLMSAPMAGGALVIGGLVMAVSKGIASVKEFNLEFRNLQNLNLDKSFGELDNLKRKVFGVSYKAGFDPGKTATAYFDVESLTGKYGNQVETILKKQGEFAQIFQADFNQYVSGTAKAMANYGFGAESLDAYNRSNYATFKTAKINFNELSNVSAMYAGTAASARQNFDSANKLMALFTVKTKSADEAATLTKSAFQDLFKPQTVKAFHSIGMNLFDVKGKAKQVGDVLIELNNRFMKLGSDKQMNSLLSKFQGSEGLISLLQVAMDKTGGLKNTLDSFDQSKFGLNKALQNARNDINYIDDLINNKLKTSWTEFGNDISPKFIKLKTGLINVMDDVHDFYLSKNKGALIGVRNSTRLSYNQEIIDKLTPELSKVPNMKPSEFKDFIGDYFSHWDRYRNKLPTDIPIFNTGSDKLDSKMYREALSDSIVKYQGYSGGYAKAIVMIDAARKLPKTNVFPSKPNNDNYSGNLNSSNDSSINQGIQGIAGGGTRNVTVIIHKIVDGGITIQTTNIKEGTTEMKRMIEEQLVRAISGAEQTVSN